MDGVGAAHRSLVREELAVRGRQVVDPVLK